MIRLKLDGAPKKPPAGLLDPGSGSSASLTVAGSLIAANGAAISDPDLIEIMPSRPEWEVPLWLVTHVDLHRTPKVQAFVAHIREAAKSWDAL